MSVPDQKRTFPLLLVRVAPEQHKPNMCAIQRRATLPVTFTPSCPEKNLEIRLNRGIGPMHNKIISTLAGVAFSLAASGLVFAADIATKAAAPSPAPVYNWTGWYVGVNAGASFGTFKTDFNRAGGTLVFNDLALGEEPSPIPGFAGRDEVYPGGFVGGGQIGFNWQFSPLWVVGLEADFQGADEKETSTLSTSLNFSVGIPGSPRPAAASLTIGTNYSTNIDWFGTARGRIGYVWGNGEVVSYVTGGLAYGEVKINGTNTVSVPAGGISLVDSVGQTFGASFGASHVNTGWVVGTGTEGKLLIPGWTYKIEGLYMDLGHLDATGPGGSSITSNAITIVTATMGPVHTHTHFTDTILRVGLNYQFH
jgi:outer membrane immunogenic protein